MMANPKRAKHVLSELAALGLRLSIDDFGTGYSSLSYLRELPVDEVKIDRSFVMRMGEHGPDAAIVRSTIDLGRNLGLDVVAEGVEDIEVWETLRELGCPIAQGYHLRPPGPRRGAHRVAAGAAGRARGDPRAGHVAGSILIFGRPWRVRITSSPAATRSNQTPRPSRKALTPTVTASVEVEPEGDRTPDLSAASRTLSQLSYGPLELERVGHVNACELAVA